jgi:hypothetical protein
MTEDISIVIWNVPPGKWAVKKKFVGSWRITELQGYDADYIDLCGPAKLKITTRGGGHINFGAVGAEIDCKMDDLDERVVRFSFEGGDEGDPICGRGYCLVDGDQMVGRIFRHFSDEFGFKAKRLSKDEKPA